MLFLPSVFAAMLLAMVPKAGYFAGPARVGESVTYEISTTTGEEPGGTAHFTTVVIHWTQASRLYSRLSDGPSGAAEILTRERGQVATTTSSSMAPLFKLLNFPAQLATTLGGAMHGDATLQVRPPANPDTLPVPTTIDIIDNGANGVMLIAKGSSSRAYGPGSRSGGRGSSGQRGAPQVPERRGGSLGLPPSIEVAVEATFDAGGQLVHEEYHETFVSRVSGQPQTVERTVTIDRVEKN